MSQEKSCKLDVCMVLTVCVLSCILGYMNTNQNDSRRNPFPTRQEYLDSRLNLRNQVVDLKAQGLSAPQIAKALDMGVANVRNIVRYARDLSRKVDTEDLS